ncbi:MAG: hypothetical protein KAR62_01665 [Sphingomonadales bacterium]|nr:hypothetical protein [Sphingomonadales bacterium]
MNILSKLSRAMQDTDETELLTNNIFSLQNHLKVVEYRSLPSFVLYSSRKVRGQLNS